jgi:hypothetical protein
MLRMRNAPRALFAGLTSALTLTLAACGSSTRLLSSQEAGSLNTTLEDVHAALNQHNCSAAQSDAIALESRVAHLPSSVNRNVRKSLEQGAATVRRLVAQDCTPAGTPTQSQTTPAATTPPSTATTPPPAPAKKKPKPPKPHQPATTPTQTGTTTGPAHGQGPGNGNGKGKGGGQGGGDSTTPTTPTTPTSP